MFYTLSLISYFFKLIIDDINLTQLPIFDDLSSSEVYPYCKTLVYYGILGPLVILLINGYHTGKFKNEGITVVIKNRERKIDRSNI